MSVMDGVSGGGMKLAGKVQVGDKLVRGEEKWAVMERVYIESRRGGGKSVKFKCKDGKGEIQEITLPVEMMVEAR